MQNSRRNFIATGMTAGAAISMAPLSAALARSKNSDKGSVVPGPRQTHPIALSTYSLWRFRNDDLRDMDRCIDLADEFGFDGIELLLYQIDQNELLSRAKLMSYKRRAQRLGLPLMGLSTHQGFVTPDRDKRQFNIDRTIGQIEMAYELGIPTMRVNSGTWGTSKDFDDLMAKRGIEEPLAVHDQRPGDSLDGVCRQLDVDGPEQVVRHGQAAELELLLRVASGLDLGS